MGDWSSYKWSNWAGNVVAEPKMFATPSTIDELQLLVADAAKQGWSIRVAGSGHSFAPVVHSGGLLLDLSKIAGVESVDPDTGEATILSGSKLYTLGEPLFNAGRAFMNQGDIDRQAIAGAVGTGTHGTGRQFGSFSNAVRAVELVTPSGDLVTIDERSSENERRAVALSLGMLGVVTRLRMATVPAYKLHERSTAQASFEACLEEYPKAEAANRHAEFWWIPPLDTAIIKTLTLTDAEPMHTPTVEHPPGTLARYLTPEQIDWSYKIFPSTRNHRFVECEYTLPIANGPAAVAAARDLIRHKHPHIKWVVEYRTLGGEQHLISPTQGADSVTVSVHEAAEADWQPFMRDADALFREHGGRPHWGKLNWLDRATAEAMYPELETFRAIRRRMDPQGVFLNDHLRPIFE